MNNGGILDTLRHLGSLGFIARGTGDGRPPTEIQDTDCSQHSSWSDHFKMSLEYSQSSSDSLFSWE